MCRDGRYTECGIKGRDGFAADVFAVEPSSLVAVPEELGLRAVLTEPASIVAKAWRRVHEVAALNCLIPERVLVTGAGPIGLLAALLGVQAGLDVHVLDLATSGPKPELVRRLGASYHSALDDCPESDVVVECTGAPALVLRVLIQASANGIVCLTGVSEHADVEVDAGEINRELVLQNEVVIGSVNAARDDYMTAVRALSRADPGWLDDLITREVPVERCAEAYEHRPGDVKTVITFEGSRADHAPG
jgi:threonine dehydrogenase-like Zn-dependent dehydrogenase